MKLRLFLLPLAVAPFALAAGDAPPWRTAESSELGFTATQEGAPFDGRFEEFNADIRFAPEELATSRFIVTVTMTSVDTDNAERDEALRSADLFDVARWPEARFEASEFRQVDGENFEAAGMLTIRDQSMPLALPFSFAPEGSGAVLSGEVPISRLAYGVGQGDWATTEWIGDEVIVKYRLTLEQ